jgi:type I restriction enzyme R subunit
MNEYSEDTLVEKPAIGLFRNLGWKSQNCYYETFGRDSTLGRETSGEVVLVHRLRPALEKLNPGVSKEGIQLALEDLTRDRGTLSPANANREIYRLLKDGVKVSVRSEEGGEETTEVVHVIDWGKPENNDFFLASQFWITGEMYTRRADLVGFVNGLPLLFMELKASHKRLEHAFTRNLRDYKDTIPHVFWYNAFLILSNGSKSRIGTITAEWEHFAEWKKINDEGEEGVVSLDTTIRGTCEKPVYPEVLVIVSEHFDRLAPALIEEGEVLDQVEHLLLDHRMATGCASLSFF